MNCPTIQTCKFQSVSQGQNVDDPDFGFRMYDNYVQICDNTWKSIPEDDFDVFEKVVTSNNVQISHLLDYMEENECGIWINGNYYTYDKIKHLIPLG